MPLFIYLIIRPDITKIASADMMIKKKALFLKRPNAAPVFSTKVRWRIFLTIGTDSPRTKFCWIRNLEYWSAKRINRVIKTKISVCFSLPLIGIVCKALRMARLLASE